MDPSELESICSPVVEEEIDYVKGNRLIHRSALLVIPRFGISATQSCLFLQKLPADIGMFRIRKRGTQPSQIRR